MTQPAPVWQALFERYGVAPTACSGVLGDPFTFMAEAARQSAQAEDRPPCTVSVLLSTASDDYSKRRCTVTITCPCPPMEKAIEFATEASYITCKNLLNRAAADFGLPMLG